MSEEVQIPKYHQTIDFDTLMQTAREHITKLAGQIWTDHNASDPGITQLEVLAFCIADLSYRTSFGVDDILAGYKGGQMTAFDLPLANVILPNNPVTIKDLRKVLIDMAHPTKPDTLLLRNAFPVIAEQTEIPFFAVSPKDQETFLSFTDLTLFESIADTEVEEEEDQDHESADDLEEKAALEEKRTSLLAADGTTASSAPLAPSSADGSNATAKNDQSYYDSIGLNVSKMEKFDNVDQIELNGLYSLQLEFEEGKRKTDDDLPIRRDIWDLNQNYFSQEVSTAHGTYELSVLLPYWDDIRWSLKDVDLNDNSTTLQYHGREIQPNVFEDYFIAVDKLNYDDYFYNYYAELDLNDHTIPAFIKVKTKQENSIIVGGKTYEFEVDFLDWNELSNGVKRNYTNSLPNHKNISPVPANAIDAVKKVEFVGVGNQENIFDIRSEFTFDKNGNRKTVNLLTRVVFTEGTLFSVNDHSTVEGKLEAKFSVLYEEQIAIEKAIFEALKLKSSSIYEHYLTKLNTVFTYLYGGANNVWSHLGQFRNLCEDYSKFTASRIQEIALFGKLSVLPAYNLSEILAEIYFRIDQFLNPLIKFKTLNEMTEKGYQFEDLFNGPLLKNGFVEDTDLENLKRRSVVYTSDLIRIIMDVEGVESVEDFSISSYIDNRLMGRNVINCLSLTNSSIYKPRLSLEKSGLQICVSDQLSKVEFLDIENWFLKKLKDFKADQIPTGEIFNLSLPKGEDMEIEKYQSIQNDFPEVYGIGPYGLPADTSDERRAQAKQLKAYLLPFEQLMTNYLKQVAHLPELFSFNRSIKDTYAYQPLYDVPDVQPLFTDFVQNGGVTWEQFKLDLNHSYAMALDAVESPNEFRSRRNRFLNQLLARFGESFTAYSRQMFDRHKALLNDPDQITAYLNERGATQDKLIEDQIAFGEDHEKVSSERYKSFNVTDLLTDQPFGVWNNSNIESYKLRLCRLLGIEKVNNAFIFGTGTDVDGNSVDQEGMHVVEHILLRPRTSASLFLNIENRKDDEGSFVYDSDKDPYSFRITLVLPKYAGRFKEESFRKFAEHLIRMETPAHIRVDFDWMSTSCGKKFEEAYSQWKNGINKLKPFYFQNIASDKQIDQSELRVDRPLYDDKLDPSGPGKLTKLKKQKANKLIDKRAVEPMAVDARLKLAPEKYEQRLKSRKGPSILTLKNILVNRMNTPCTLSLKVYDANEIIMNPVGQVVEFEHYKTDVYNIRVSETGGVLTLYAWDQSKNDWTSKKEYKPVDDLYFNVSLFIPDGDGLTTEYGGQGAYKLVYQMDDLREVAQIIRVTKAIIHPNIFIGWRIDEDGQMLTFDTENDGVFRISNRTWKGYFLQFLPTNRILHNGEIVFGSAYISSPSKGLPPTSLGDERGELANVLLSDIYAEYGAGVYHITYELDGQVTFADIELFVELSIKVYNQKTELLENADGKIIVPNGLRKVDLFFDLPEGSLKVYDLDGVSISGSNGKSPSNPFGELDSNPFGTVDYHKTIGNLLINRNSNPIYQDGHCYLFVYEFEGLTAQKTICFEAPELQPPTIELLDSNEVMLEEPFVLDVNNERKKYAVRFYPKDSVATVWVFVEGVKKVIETMTIPSDDHVEDIEVQDLYKNYGKGPFFIENKNAVGEVLTQFTLNYKTDKRIPELTLLANGEELIDEPFLLDPRKAEYALKVNEVGGSLRLTSVEGIVILEIDVVEHLETYLDLFEMGKLSKGAPIHAVYIVEDNADELEFSITMIHDPEPLTLTIFNSGTEKQVDSKDGIYDLVFDYKNPKQYFEFKFSKGPGTIKMMDEKGEEYSISVESDYSRFNGVDKLPIGLTSGDYECTYQSENDDAIEFRLNVINLNPTFILTDIGYERPNYLATAVPVNAKAQAYIWRVDGEYVSRAKEPVLELNFGRGKTLEIELTLHLEDYESNYSIKLNRNDIKKMRDEQ